jgi:elongation factor Ts
MEIKAADVMKLRHATNAGMMDCKKALQEAEGDFDKAVDIIRKRGLIVASKRADREAKEGCVLAHAEGKKGVLVSLNCETDFVAKNENFINFTKRSRIFSTANVIPKPNSQKSSNNELAQATPLPLSFVV